MHSTTIAPLDGKLFSLGVDSNSKVSCTLTWYYIFIWKKKNCFHY